MFNHFGKTYMASQYRNYRENILFEKELGLLPMTQPHVERAIAVEEKEKEFQELVQCQMQIVEKMKQNRREMEELKSNTRATDTRKYVRKCPKNDCHGFLSQNLKCEICSSWVCSECREIKGLTRDAEHTCHPEILESVKAMAADTKACPSCSALIYKIEGCLQMFCTECHTAFNWNTLRIETGVIHNPHYFEWMRMQHGQMERNPNDILCGREICNRFSNKLTRTLTALYNRCYTHMSAASTEEHILNTIQPFFQKGAANGSQMHIEMCYNIRNEYNDSNIIGYTHSLAKTILQFSKRHIPEKYTEIKKVLNEHPGELFMNNVLIPFETYIRNIIHVHHVEIPRWVVADPIQMNLDLRIQYMRNQTTTDQFKTQIQKRDKVAQRNLEISNILRMFVSCITDLMYRVLDEINQFTETRYSIDEMNLFLNTRVLATEDTNGSTRPPTLLDECHALRNYTNQCLESVFRVYGNVANHKIDQEFYYIRCTQ